MDTSLITLIASSTSADARLVRAHAACAVRWTARTSWNTKRISPGRIRHSITLDPDL